MRKTWSSAPISVGGVVFCACLCSLFTTNIATADTFHVAPCGSNTWTGQSPVCVGPDGPKRTIQTGIDLAGNGDEVVLADGTYTGSGNVKLSFDGRLITVRSESGDPALCIIDCEDAANTYGIVFDGFETNAAVLDGITIRNGNSGLGAGICCLFSSPTLRNCVLSGNDAAQGGGGLVCTSDASPIVENCTFTGNTGDIGGAVSLYDRCDPVFDNCTFTGNIAGTAGGAIDATNDCDFTVTGSLFQSNSVTDTGLFHGGGAVRARDFCRPTLTDCMFRDHVAQDRGGAILAVEESRIDATSCVFSGNVSLADGGAIAAAGPLVTLNLADCRFFDNSSQNGGAIHSDRSFVSLTGCSLTGNRAVTDGGALHQTDGSETAIVDGRFSGNLANNHAGAIFNGEASRFTGANVSFSGNVAMYLGGGILNIDADQMTLTNASFSGNAAPIGGAIANIDSATTLVNSIVSGNGGGGVVDLFGPETDATYCLIEGGWSGPGPGNIDADPRFMDPDGPDDIVGTDDDDLRLRSDSPCIDAGDNDAPGLAGVTTDIDGNPRFFDDPETPDTGNGEAPLVDMGGFEFQGTDCPLDIDGNGAVGFGDVLRILAGWGNSGGPEDVDDDGVVGFGDVLTILSQWGPC